MTRDESINRLIAPVIALSIRGGSRAGARRADAPVRRLLPDTRTIRVLDIRLRLGVTLKSVTLGNVTMSHRRERANALRLSHSTMIGLPRN
ncbi:hypothetical protein EVAR_30049_1 [Eumeta japonica]|uniref:Uncharacterized protein n=1 Tax=Eumeta variegata TaxID=151549 RepID=A0A4C1VTD8_EUMVA|nr:hypothetical protein EVAR_30049_1 [Eumeta japonica]